MKSVSSGLVVLYFNFFSNSVYFHCSPMGLPLEVKRVNSAALGVIFSGFSGWRRAKVFLCPSLRVGLALLAASLVPLLAWITRQNNFCSAG